MITIWHCSLLNILRRNTCRQQRRCRQLEQNVTGQHEILKPRSIYFKPQNLRAWRVCEILSPQMTKQDFCENFIADQNKRSMQETLPRTLIPNMPLWNVRQFRVENPDENDSSCSFTLGWRLLSDFQPDMYTSPQVEGSFMVGRSLFHWGKRNAYGRGLWSTDFRQPKTLKFELTVWVSAVRSFKQGSAASDN